VTLRLLTYNVRYGGAGREAALASVIRASGADVIVLQEATRPAVVQALATACGMSEWGSKPGQSLGFLSRVPLEPPEWHQPRGSRHAFLELAPAGMRFRVFGVHLSAVHAAWTEQRRVRELRALLAGIRHQQEGFHVLTGDFNTLAPGELLDIRRLPLRLRPFVWLSGGQIRWRTIQEVLDARYVDVFRSLNPFDSAGGRPPDAGLTFPTWDPHVRLDYVFVPALHARRITACEVVRTDAAREASDHFPLTAEVDV
jgi:endonuclease/exonuclease/phosphatase family metal-dependent hydrolase